MWKPIVPPKRKKEKEIVNQRNFVRCLNDAGIGCFFRVRKIGAIDPEKGTYRKWNDLGQIPHIIGFRKHTGQAVFIECKFVQRIEKRKPLVFPVKITKEQKDFLLAAHNAGAIAGVAFTLEDAIAIAHDSQMEYPRHPRTFCFLPKEDLEEYVGVYKETKKALCAGRRDPLFRDILG